MTVIDINNKQILYQTPDFPEHILWATKEYWVEYQAFCRELEKHESAIWYGR